MLLEPQAMLEAQTKARRAKSTKMSIYFNGKVVKLYTSQCNQSRNVSFSGLAEHCITALRQEMFILDSA